MTRTTAHRLLNAALLLLFVTPVLAQGGAEEMTPEQKAMMEAYIKAGTPGEQHSMLAERVGDYEVTAKSWQDPGAPPVEEKGTARRTMIMDGRIMVETYNGTMQGTPFTGQGMTGYDNVSGKWWSTWNDSMSTGIMMSQGTCDAKMVCTFTGSWNDPITQGPITARMTSRPEGAGTEIFEMYGPGPDGKEIKMMELTYRKK
jgi:hypothetical protein